MLQKTRGEKINEILILNFCCIDVWEPWQYIQEADDMLTLHIFVNFKKPWIQLYISGYINIRTVLALLFCAISLVFSHLSLAPLMFPIAAPILLVQMKLINTISPARYQAQSFGANPAIRATSHRNSGHIIWNGDACRKEEKKYYFGLKRKREEWASIWERNGFQKQNG